MNTTDRAAVHLGKDYDMNFILGKQQDSFSGKQKSWLHELD